MEELIILMGVSVPIILIGVLCGICLKEIFIKSDFFL